MEGEGSQRRNSRYEVKSIGYKGAGGREGGSQKSSGEMSHCCWTPGHVPGEGGNQVEKH